MTTWEKLERRREETENINKFKEEIITIIDECIIGRDLKEEHQVAAVIHNYLYIYLSPVIKKKQLIIG